MILLYFIRRYFNKISKTKVDCMYQPPKLGKKNPRDPKIR